MARRWNRLDNAAKIFPSSTSKSETQVFRFSCELYEEINPEILQRAVSEAAEEFPVYQVVLKRGLFWYYLESTDLKPVVEKEHKPLCSALYFRGVRSLLYEVSYFRGTINLEMFHVLTDGTGAMNFLRTIVAKYLCIVDDIPLPDLDLSGSFTQMEDDSFKKYNRQSRKIRNDKTPRAVALSGTKYPDHRLKLIRGTASTKAMLDLAHDYGVSLTTLICSLLLESINDEIPVRAKRRPVILAVPVNLRQYFESFSARNFFSVISTSFNFADYDDKFEKIIKKVEKDFKKGLTLESVSGRIDTYMALERNVFARAVPLFIKNPILKIANDIAKKDSTATVSNVGVVKMPEEFSGLIRSFDVCNSTQKLQLCICSYGDTLSMSFTGPFVSSDIQQRFFRMISGRGIKVEIATNQAGSEE